MKKKFYAACAGILSACLGFANLSVSAYTPDDVASKAREAGWPENLIQSGYNQWASGEYTQDQLDQAYESVLDYTDQTREYICNLFGIDPDDEEFKFVKKEKPETQPPATQPPAAQPPAAPPSPAPDVIQEEEEYVQEYVEETRAPKSTTTQAKQTTSSKQTTTTTTTTSKDQSSTQSSTTSKSKTESGTKTSDQFIPDSEFISMTIEEKQEYVNSLDADEKIEFIANLSTEARNSIIKQLPTEEKMAIMQKYIDTAGAMGMNVTVDEITDNDISVTVRNHDGIVIDKAEVGIVIDETGISHTKPWLFAGIGILASAGGFAWLYWYIKRTEND